MEGNGIGWALRHRTHHTWPFKTKVCKPYPFVPGLSRIWFSLSWESSDQRLILIVESWLRQSFHGVMKTCTVLQSIHVMLAVVRYFYLWAGVSHHHYKNQQLEELIVWSSSHVNCHPCPPWLGTVITPGLPWGLALCLASTCLPLRIRSPGGTVEQHMLPFTDQRRHRIHIW